MKIKLYFLVSLLLIGFSSCKKSNGFEIKGEISDELLYRPKVYFAKGCRTGDMMQAKKETLKSQLKSLHLYKDQINQNKFFQYA